MTAHDDYWLNYDDDIDLAVSLPKTRKEDLTLTKDDQAWFLNDQKRKREKSADADAMHVLAAFRQDLCDWINTILKLELKENTLIDSLSTGTILCQLAETIDEGEEKTREADRAFQDKARPSAVPLTPPRQSMPQSPDNKKKRAFRRTHSSLSLFSPRKSTTEPVQQAAPTSPTPARASASKSEPKLRVKKRRFQEWEDTIPPTDDLVAKLEFRPLGIGDYCDEEMCPGCKAAERNCKAFVAWLQSSFSYDAIEWEHLFYGYNQRKILFMLYDLARNTRWMPLPKIIVFERMPNAVFEGFDMGGVTDPELKELFRLVQKEASKCKCAPPLRVRYNSASGRFVIVRAGEPHVTKLYVSGKQARMRSGGGGMSLSQWLNHYDPCRRSNTMRFYAVYEYVRKHQEQGKIRDIYLTNIPSSADDHWINQADYDEKNRTPLPWKVNNHRLSKRLSLSRLGFGGK
eukprot:m.111558 g.111558  ORF g.111558 m.111558 type:complete len:459 (-) comp22786_c0_seq3:142-1518(-)